MSILLLNVMGSTEVTACLFGLDGIIVDLSRYHYLAWKRLAKEIGFDFREEDYPRIQAYSRIESLNTLLRIGGVEIEENKKNELANKKNQWFLDYILQLTPNDILPGVIEFINELSLNGVKLAMVSNSKNARVVIEQLGLSGMFDYIADGTLLSLNKSPDYIIISALQTINASPEKCIYFINNPVGITLAKNVGLCCFGIGKSELLSNSDFIIEDFQDFGLQNLNSCLDQS